MDGMERCVSALWKVKYDGQKNTIFTLILLHDACSNENELLIFVVFNLGPIINASVIMQ